MFRLRDEKDIAGCAISAVMSEAGERFSGETILRSIANMHERGNGLGGGFAAYGIYPEYRDLYAFHLLFEDRAAQAATRAYLASACEIVHEEELPTRAVESVRDRPILRRCFLTPRPGAGAPSGEETEEDAVVRIVMQINCKIDGAFVVSSGKNMGVFKGVGYPEELGRFFRIDEYAGHTWLAHSRFPTNTPGWWGGAHPFGLLGWTVVHNGEVSSYGINRRYLEQFGYHCTLQTDTEVIGYLFDLLLRRHALPLELAARVLAPPFWSQIARAEPEARQLLRALRIVYGGALLNGPFSVVVGHPGGMFGLTDRTKLRPLVAARRGELLYLSSEEAGIREVCDSPDAVWHAEGGVPIVGTLKEKTVAQVAGPA